MSVFSDTLEKLIEKKGVRVLPLAKHCGVERSTLYKFMSGKRVPGSTKILEKAADFLQLTPVEKQELFDTWKIVHIGEETWYRRRKIEEFICHFPARPTSAPAAPDTGMPETALAAESGCLALSSPQAVDYYVHQMILTEFHRKTGRIGLLLQTDYHFLFQLLASLKPTGKPEISHILCMDVAPEVQGAAGDGEGFCLYAMLPVYMNDLDYHPFYFYDSVDSHFHNLNALPCMILATDAAILCSSDYKKGIYYQDTAVIEMLWNTFSGYRDRCAPLFHAASVTPENYFSVMKGLQGNTETLTSLIALKPEGCFQPFLTQEIIRESLKDSLPEPDLVADTAYQAFALNRDRTATDKLLVYFTEEGLSHFARTGLIEEIPEVFYHPLAVGRRLEILEQIAGCCRNGSWRMLKSPLSHLSENLHLCVWEPDRGGISFHSNAGNLVMLLPCETGILGAFYDYLSNIDPELCYPEEEAARQVEAIAQRLADDAKNT